MARGNFGGFPPPLKSIGIACSRMFSDMYHWTVNDAQLLWRASQHARGRFTKGYGSLGRRCGLLSNYFDLLLYGCRAILQLNLLPIWWTKETRTQTNAASYSVTEVIKTIIHRSLVRLTRIDLTRGRTDRVLTFDLVTQPWPSILGELLPWPIHLQKVKVKGHSVQKLQWKQSDGWTDGPADCITFHANAVGNYVSA